MADDMTLQKYEDISMMKLSCGLGSHIRDLIAIGIPESADDTCTQVIEGEALADMFREPSLGSVSSCFVNNTVPDATD